MRSIASVILATLCQAGIVCVEEQLIIHVSVCNLGDVHAGILEKAKTEAATVFRSAGVRIVWTDCGDFASQDARGFEVPFIIRLRSDKPPRAAGPLSLDMLGNAFVAEDGNGYLADAYFPAIETVAKEYGGDASGLLGLVITHELGHLLRGAGHSPDGVMRTRWGRKEISALQKRWFKFDEQDAAKIRRKLQAKSGS